MSVVGAAFQSVWIFCPPALGGAIFLRLRSTDVGVLAAAVVSVVTAVQPEFTNAIVVIQSVLFGLAVYACASSSIAPTQRQDPRRIVLFGGSLAGAQLVNPICGMAATFFLPLAFRRSLPAATAARTAGLLISMLFLPVLAGVALLCLSWRGTLSMRYWPSLSFAEFSWRLWPLAFLALSAIPPVVGLMRYSDKIRTPVLGALTGSVMLAGLVVCALGQGSELAGCAAGLGALLIATVSVWPRTFSATREMIVLAFANTISAWLLFVVSAGYRHV